MNEFIFNKPGFSDVINKIPDFESNPLGKKLANALIQKIKVHLSGGFTWEDEPMGAPPENFTPFWGDFRDIFFPELKKSSIYTATDVPYNDIIDKVFATMAPEHWQLLCVALVCLNIRRAKLNLAGEVDLPKVMNAIEELKPRLLGEGGINFQQFYQELYKEQMGEVLQQIPNVIELKKVLTSEPFLSEYNENLQATTKPEAIDWFWYHIWHLFAIKIPEDTTQLSQHIDDVAAAIQRSTGRKISENIGHLKWLNYTQWLTQDNLFHIAQSVLNQARKMVFDDGAQLALTVPHIYPVLFLSKKVQGISPWHNDAPGQVFYTTQATPPSKLGTGLLGKVLSLGKYTGVIGYATSKWLSDDENDPLGINM
ncbi:hypothetical protein [Microscilla marina]|uniref:Uncharacterized protein n=1 Tax=Microscilla marina ATCC 23134 TaxID=313606 RepID=A1ZUM0_MICM2|nr:hypothetical protein [Microscilla marina]EAY25906.1 hypothetical protein M23134_00860 [Microscilla marina ATCC 23134]